MVKSLTSALFLGMAAVSAHHHADPNDLFCQTNLDCYRLTGEGSPDSPPCCLYEGRVGGLVKQSCRNENYYNYFLESDAYDADTAVWTNPMNEKEQVKVFCLQVEHMFDEVAADWEDRDTVELDAVEQRIDKIQKEADLIPKWYVMTGFTEFALELLMAGYAIGAGYQGYQWGIGASATAYIGTILGVIGFGVFFQAVIALEIASYAFGMRTLTIGGLQSQALDAAERLSQGLFLLSEKQAQSGAAELPKDSVGTLTEARFGNLSKLVSVLYRVHEQSIFCQIFVYLGHPICQVAMGIQMQFASQYAMPDGAAH